MAGHSHSANNAHRKGLVDAKRGKLFSKLCRAVYVAAKNGGGDPDSNLKLRYAIDKARSYSCPKENIERSITKATGELGAENFEEVVYEGYGPGGVAVMVKALTDNKNRTAPEIRHVFTKFGGNLAEVGSVGWMFERKGLVQVDAHRVEEDELLALALDAGAADLRRVDQAFEITTTPQELEGVRRTLEERGVPIRSAEVSYVPQSTIRLEGRDAQQVLRLVEGIEELEDVQHVYANFDIPDEVLEAIGAA